MVVAEVVGVGIFLSPAEMMRTLGSVSGALVVWLSMGALTAAGALCYAELATRYPRAGGGYVFLREAYGPRIAFIYGWMALLVMDPGIAAALAIGLSQYLLVVIGAPTSLLTPLALLSILAFGGLTLAGFSVSAHVMRWSAAAKILGVVLLLLAGLFHAAGGATLSFASTGASAPGFPQIAGAIVAAFFAFGGWWELGRMAGEVREPRRTMPRALLGGVALVTLIYAMVTMAFVLVTPEGKPGSDDQFVLMVGSALFGEAAGRVLALMVVIAVAGSLAAVLFGAPRVYLAMARDGLFPSQVARYNERRGTAPGGTLVQMTIASLLVLIGTFNEILGYFVPAAVLFLGLSAAAVLVLPRPASDAPVFRVPWHPLPIILFLTFIAVVLVLFAMGQPRQTALGAVIVAIGIPVSYLVIPRGVTRPASTGRADSEARKP